MVEQTNSIHSSDINSPYSQSEIAFSDCCNAQNSICLRRVFECFFEPAAEY